MTHTLKFTALLAAFGFALALPATAKAADGFAGSYVSGDVNFGSLDHDIGAIGDVGGSNIGVNIGVGYRAPLNMMDLPLFWGGEIAFGFGTLDEDETTSTTATTVDPDGASAAGDARECGTTATPADCTSITSATLTQTFTAEESWNININGDIGYMVNPDFLAFFRIGYVFAGGADVNSTQAIVGGDAAAITQLAVADTNNANVYANHIYDEALADTPTDATFAAGANNVVNRAVSEADNSFLVGVGGQYLLGELVAPGLSARGLVTYNLGDRSGVEVKVGAVWSF